MNLNHLLSTLELSEKPGVFFYKESQWTAFVSKEVENKFHIIQPTAFYIFNHEPYILFFDLTNELNAENRQKEIYKQVWSFDRSPIIFIIKGNDFEVFNALQTNNKGVLLAINNAEALQKCKFWELQSGATLEWFYEKYKANLLKKRVNQRLFNNIKDTIEKLKNQGIAEKNAKVLVLRLIFVRYLIDRKIRLNKNYIDGHEDEVVFRRQSFSNLIKQPQKLKEFFNYLDGRFNGVLFKEYNFELSQTQADILSNIFDPFNAPALFEYNLFDFAIIPVELISGIYETLLDKDIQDATSAIYTPPFLVDYILTETIDKFYQKEPQKSEVKVFDPAMGSGIFLVQAFRRMVDREQVIYPEKEITKLRLQQIAENNLFGIDINQEAIHVACFSIYVALLDYLKPADIDEINHQFPNLDKKNFLLTNFFTRKISAKDTIETQQELQQFQQNIDILKAQKFDFILGNPPWDKHNKQDYHLGWLNENKIHQNKVKGEQEIALSYLMRVNDFMQENTVTALVVTSTIFYNVAETTRFVKNKFWETYSVQNILDLSPVRRLVFDSEKIIIKENKKTGKLERKKQQISNPALIIQFQKYNEAYSEQIPIRFQSIKMNRFFNDLFKNLVIEKFDTKNILQKYFKQHQWLFKVALYGNTLDFLFLKKLEENKKKIADLIDGKTVFKGAGIKSNKGKHFADFLVGLPLIENSNVQDFYTPIYSSCNLLNKNEVYFESGRIKELFIGNKILLKEQARKESELVVSYLPNDGVYKNGVWGIASMNTEIINIMYSLFISNLYTYFIYLTSGSWGTSTRPQIRLDDEYLSFPYKEPSSHRKEQLLNLVEKLLAPYKAHYANYPDMVYQGEPDAKVLAEINEIVNEIYEVQPHEKDLIDYVLNVARYQFQDSKQHLVSKFTHKEGDCRNKKWALEQYAQVFIDAFSKIYDNDYIQVEVYELNHFFAVHFLFLDKKPKNTPQVHFVEEVNDTQKLLKKLSSLSISSLTSIEDNEQNLFIQKDIKGFEENAFYVIKPDEYKCWHRAMAWYDVAEFKEAIQEAELERIKSRNQHG